MPLSLPLSNFVHETTSFGCRTLRDVSLHHVLASCMHPDFIGFDQVIFLGHTLQGDCIKPQDKSVGPILNTERPKTKKSCRSLLGMINFYRQYIPNCAEVIASLTELTKNRAPNNVEWDSEQERAFKEVKKILSSEPILKLPDLNRGIWSHDLSRAILELVNSRHTFTWLSPDRTCSIAGSLSFTNHAFRFRVPVFSKLETNNVASHWSIISLPFPTVLSCVAIHITISTSDCVGPGNILSSLVCTHCIRLIMTALWNRAGHYIFAMWFLSFFLFFLCLISTVADWMSTILPHSVVLVRV